MSPFNEPWFVVYTGILFILTSGGFIFWSHYYRRHPIRIPVVDFLGHLFYFVLAVAFMGTGVSMIAGVINGFHLDWNIVLYCTIASVVVTIVLMSPKTQRSVSKKGARRGNS